VQHPSDLELVQWTAGGADSGGAEAIRPHLDACEACRRKAAELGRVHAALRRWTPEPPPADLWPAVQECLGRDARPQRVLPRWPALLRWAAAVALAGFLGHLAARAVRHGMGEPAAGPGADVQTVAAYLHLHAVTEKHPPGVSRSLDVLLEEVTP
jgi:anti-sigma factor RsiW